MLKGRMHDEMTIDVATEVGGLLRGRGRRERFTILLLGLL